MFRKREWMDGYSGHVPWMVTEAANSARKQRERAFADRASYLAGWIGVPLAVACVLFLVAVPVLFVTVPAALVLFAASVVSLLCAAVSGVRVWLVGLRNKRDRDLFYALTYAYGLESLGGPGKLPPKELLSLAATGSVAAVRWRDEALADPVLRESFYSLSEEWSGDSESLVEACVAL